MAAVDEWLELLDARVSVEDASATITRALAALDQAIAQDEDATATISAILARRLSDPLGTTTWVETQSSLATYGGDDLPLLLTWAAQLSATEARVDQISSMGSARAIATLRSLLGRYGFELGTAYELSNQIDSDWRTVNQNVFYDALTERYLFRTRILTYKDGTYQMDFPPNSMLQFARIMLSSLPRVSSIEVYDPDLVAALMQTMADFADFAQPPEPQAEAQTEATTATLATATPATAEAQPR